MLDMLDGWKFLAGLGIFLFGMFMMEGHQADVRKGFSQHSNDIICQLNFFADSL